MSFWNCSVVNSFSSNWVSTSLGADYCLKDRESFSVFTYSRLNTRGGWENLRKLFKPHTQSRVCITFKKFSNLPRVFKWDNVNTGKKYLIYYKHLSHKLRCYTRISGPEKSCNNTREKISYFFTCVDIANQLLTRHSPLAPLGQVDEWTAKPSRFSIQVVCRSFLKLWRLKH